MVMYGPQPPASLDRPRLDEPPGGFREFDYRLPGCPECGAEGARHYPRAGNRRLWRAWTSPLDVGWCTACGTLVTHTWDARRDWRWFYLPPSRFGRQHQQLALF